MVRLGFSFVLKGDECLTIIHVLLLLARRFPNQIRRSEELAKKNIMFVGMGISGGEEGARNGPSLMPGGPREAYDLIEPILKKCAAQAGDPVEPCTGYCGPIGAGNYVKMVHNGIEYGDMQLIGEIYDILKVGSRWQPNTSRFLWSMKVGSRTLRP